MKVISIAACMVPLGLLTGTALGADVVVNGVRLEDSTRQTLERTYGVPIKPGKYWYDAVSGVWAWKAGRPRARSIPAYGSAGRSSARRRTERRGWW
jgi:hypothetical protein